MHAGEMYALHAVNESIYVSPAFFKAAWGTMIRVSLLLLTSAFVFLCAGPANSSRATKAGGAIMEITITSSAFSQGGMIPAEYTCDGSDISPPLSWSDVPDSTESLAIICDDPDAPVGIWVHWVLFDIPSGTRELPRDIPPDKILESGAKHGINDFKKYGYGGPCPPEGTHRYYFKIYALNKKIALQPGISKTELLKKMEGHIVAEGRLMGTYRR